MNQADFVIKYLCRNGSITQRKACATGIEIYNLDHVISLIRKIHGKGSVITTMISVKTALWGTVQIASYSISKELKEKTNKPKKKFPAHIFNTNPQVKIHFDNVNEQKDE